MQKIEMVNVTQKDTFYFEVRRSDGETVTVEFDSNGKTEILEKVQRFLNAAGYTFFGTLTDYIAPKESVNIMGRPSKSLDKEKWPKGEGYRMEGKPEHEPTWDFSNIPNNNWPFGKLTPQPIPTLTTADLAKIQPVDLSSLTVTDLTTGETKSHSEWANINKYPTMAPLTSEQLESFSFKTEMPGTLGSAKVNFRTG